MPQSLYFALVQPSEYTGASDILDNMERRLRPLRKSDMTESNLAKTQHILLDTFEQLSQFSDAALVHNEVIANDGCAPVYGHAKKILNVAARNRGAAQAMARTRVSTAYEPTFDFVDRERNEPDATEEDVTVTEDMRIAIVNDKLDVLKAHVHSITDYAQYNTENRRITGRWKSLATDMRDNRKRAGEIAEQDGLHNIALSGGSGMDAPPVKGSRFSVLYNEMADEDNEMAAVAHPSTEAQMSHAALKNKHGKKSKNKFTASLV